MTLSPDGAGAQPLGPPRWDGSRGRVEVWYATFNDERSGTGYWLHYETVAPVTAGDDPYNHGWAAVFPVAGEPAVERFGPCTAAATDPGAWFSAGGGSTAVVANGRLSGGAGRFGWDLTFEDRSPPLHTFGRHVWERRLLPGAQCVPWPCATFTGTFDVGEGPRPVGGRGAVARIYGHSSAQRWCWLHADLDADGATLELVAATARRPGLRRLPPLAMAQLRLPGHPDRPRVPALGALALRTRIGTNGFNVSGLLGASVLRVTVALPAERSVSLTYTDPDGSTATCTNSEVADATVTLGPLGRGVGRERRWEIIGRAHAETGRRP